MDEFESLSHSKWECKYHVVFIPDQAPRGGRHAARPDETMELTGPPKGGPYHAGPR